jgi:hypothetical protein
MKNLAYALAIVLFGISSCDDQIATNKDAEILGIWDFKEYIYVENGTTYNGLYTPGADEIVYHFEKPSTTGYLWVEVFETNILRETSDTYEYQIVSDSLILQNAGRLSNRTISTHYEIQSISSGKMTLSWYSDLPNKSERMTVVLEKR